MTCFNTLGRLVSERMHAFSFGRPQNWANFKGPQFRRHCLKAGAETYSHLCSMLSFSPFWSPITWVLEPFLFISYHKCFF